MSRGFTRRALRLAGRNFYRTLTFSSLAVLALAQDPYRVAGDHYHLAFENAYVRASRVTYEAHGSAPLHDHPSTPVTIYVYVTNGGEMEFHHVTGEHVEGYTAHRPAVEAGAIRIAHGQPETHTVDYKGSTPMEYARIELRTDPVDRAIADKRLPPVPLDPSNSAAKVQFENGQFRIIRVMCSSGLGCPGSEHPGDPAAVVIMSGPRRGEIEWSPGMEQGQFEAVRIELKTRPVR